MEVWHIWVIIALVFIIVEIFTAGFAVFCISVGALCAAIAAACQVNLTWQIVIFAVGTLVGFILIRPLLIKYFFKGKDSNIKTNADALLGKTVIVCEAIDEKNNTGRIKVDGDEWRSVSDDGSHIDVGEKVIITEINSIILTVKKL